MSDGSPIVKGYWLTFLLSVLAVGALIVGVVVLGSC